MGGVVTLCSCRFANVVTVVGLSSITEMSYDIPSYSASHDAKTIKTYLTSNIPSVEPTSSTLTATVVSDLQTTRVLSDSLSKKLVSVTPEVAIISINMVSLFQTYTLLSPPAPVFPSLLTTFSDYPSTNGFVVLQPSSTVDMAVTSSFPTTVSISTKPFSSKLSLPESSPQLDSMLPTEIDKSSQAHVEATVALPSPTLFVVRLSTQFRLSPTLTAALTVSVEESYNITSTVYDVSSYTKTVVSTVGPSSRISSQQSYTLMRSSTGISSKSIESMNSLIQQTSIVFKATAAPSYMISKVSTVVQSLGISFHQPVMSVPPSTGIDSKSIDSTDSSVMQQSTVYKARTTRGLETLNMTHISRISSQQSFTLMQSSTAISSKSIESMNLLIQQTSIVFKATAAPSYMISKVSTVVQSLGISSHQPVMSVPPSTDIDSKSIDSTDSSVMQQSTVYKAQTTRGLETLNMTHILSQVATSMSMSHQSKTVDIPGVSTTVYRVLSSPINISSSGMMFVTGTG